MNSINFDVSSKSAPSADETRTQSFQYRQDSNAFKDIMDGHYGSLKVNIKRAIQTLRDYMQPYWTLQDNIGPYRTLKSKKTCKKTF